RHRPLFHGASNELSRHSATRIDLQRCLPIGPDNVFGTVLFLRNAIFLALRAFSLGQVVAIFSGASCFPAGGVSPDGVHRESEFRKIFPKLQSTAKKHLMLRGNAVAEFGHANIYIDARTRQIVALRRWEELCGACGHGVHRAGYHREACRCGVIEGL
ncbi:hypothetical protein Lal_00037215, partial [Lupinus albus]